MIQRQQIDSVILSRKLTILFFFIMTVVASFFVLKTGNRLFMVMLVALPFGLILMRSPSITLVMALILNATLLPVPGLASNQFGFVGLVILSGTYVAGISMGHLEWRPEKTPQHKWIKFYFFLLVVIILFRGTGLRILGSSKWGGTQYVAQFVSILSFFVLSGFIICRKHIRWIAWGSLIAGAIGSYFTWKTGWSFGESGSEVTQGRLSYLRAFYLALYPIAFAFKPKRIRWGSLFLILASIATVSLTGFRSYTIGAIMILIGYGFFKANNKIGYISAVSILGLLAWGGIVAISEILPIGIQRSFSFIPGVNVGGEVMTNAATSIDFRIEIWKYCIQHMREYLWIGRGVTFDVLVVLKNTSQMDIQAKSTWFMYETHSYHSGPLALLIDLGIPGFVFFASFCILSIKQVWGYAVRLAKINTFEARYTLFLCVSLLWDLVSFFFVFGSIARISFAIFGLAVVSMLSNSVFKMNATKLEQDLDR